MDQRSKSQDEAVACDFFDMFVDDQECGRTRPLAEYLARFPGDESVIAKTWLELRGESERLAEHDDRTIGPYRLIRELGRGGQGVVHLAIDERTGRSVALKVLDRVALGSELRRERLRRETKLLAGLDHRAIGQVLEAQLDAEPPYAAMRLVDGESLERQLARARRSEALDDALIRGLPSDRAAIDAILGAFADVARALDAAHEHGVVHRDVKPGNLLVARDGTLVLVDFGLAVQPGEDTLALTRTGEAWGTLAYMSPEQVRGRRDVDRRADVYSLAVTLYECLTLRRPFEEDDRDELRRAVLTGSGTDPLAHNGALPPDLSAVLARGMDPERDQRYPSAVAFADDLDAVRLGRRVHVRPPGSLRLLRRWAARHPKIATAAAVAFASLSIGLVITISLLLRLSREQERLWYTGLAHRATTLAEDDPAAALELAVAAARNAPHPDTSTQLLAVLDKCHEIRSVLRAQLLSDVWLHDAVADLSPDGRLVAIGLDGEGFRVVRVDDGTIEFERKGRGSGRVAIRFTPDGSRLIVGCADGRLRAHDPRSGDVDWELPPTQGEVRSIEFANGAPRFVAIDSNALVRVVEYAVGTEVWRTNRHPTARYATLSPDGGAVITSTEQVGPGRFPGGPAVVLHEIATADDPALPLDDVQIWVRRVAWSSNGRFFLVAGDDGIVRVRSRIAPTRAGIDLTHGERVWWAGFTPDGEDVVTLVNGRLSVWSLGSHERTTVVDAFDDRPAAYASFSPDGSVLAVVSWDRTLHLFATADWSLVARHRGLVDLPYLARWDGSGTRVITTTERGNAQVWYAQARPYLQVLDGRAGRVVDLDASADGAHVLTCASDGSATLWDVGSSHIERTYALSDPSPARVARLAPEGRVLIGDESGRITLFPRNADVEPLVAHAHAGAIVDAFASRDRVVAIGEDGLITVWTSPALQPIGTTRIEGGTAICMAAHPDGSVVAVGGSDRRVRMVRTDDAHEQWVSEPWPLVVRLDPIARVFDLAFAPDGARVAAACEDGRLRVWDTPSGELLLVIDAGITPGCIGWDPSGRLLATGGRWSGVVRCFEAATGELVMSTNGPDHANTITRLAFTHGSSRLLTASKDHGVRLWDLASGDLLLVLQGHSGPVTEMLLHPDGTEVMTASHDGTVRIWPLDPLELAERVRPRPGGAADLLEIYRAESTTR